MEKLSIFTNHASETSTYSQPVQVCAANFLLACKDCTDISPVGNDGAFTQIDSLLNLDDLLFSTTEETRVGRAFAMYDTDGDGRYSTGLTTMSKS